jgi:predicted DsbA family dithiol-disulfide isomerase
MTSVPVLELYSSIECPFAYLAIYRLRQAWPAYAGRIKLAWRALSLEYINKVGNSHPLFEAELKIIRQIEPSIPMQSWSRPVWDWPVTLWPAFEALACAQAQSPDAAFAASWALRHAYFAESRNIALRHELMAVAERVAQEAPLDLERFAHDWDSGRYKPAVLSESRRGWHELKVDGSPTFVLPDGRQVSNPAVGDIDFDEASYTLRSYQPYEGNPLALIRRVLDDVIRSQTAV